MVPPFTVAYPSEHRIGIISSLAFCPDYSGLYAAGTFSSSIGLLSEETGEDILVYLDDVPGPVTQVQVPFTWDSGRLTFDLCLVAVPSYEAEHPLCGLPTDK